jgi:hypothetical protein
MQRNPVVTTTRYGIPDARGSIWRTIAGWFWAAYLLAAAAGITWWVSNHF